MEARAWTCPGDRRHVLGVVVRQANGVLHLLMYRTAVDLSDLTPGPFPKREWELEDAEVDVIATVEGAVDVRCSICGAIRTWVPSPAAVRKMLAGIRT